VVQGDGGNALLGLMLSVALMVGIIFVVVNLGVAQIKTANLSVPAPLLFVPK
jgi:hypothetical protein